MELPFKQVDVFTTRPFMGNPVAVVLGAEGLSGADMQRIANWTNLSETTFVLPPTVTEADYRVRIFTPRMELPFAGHPTLGTAHAVLESGFARLRNGSLLQECGAGLISVAAVGEGADRVLTLTMPAADLRPVAPTDVDDLEAILGAAIDRSVPPAIITTGPTWLVARLRAGGRAVAALNPDWGRLAAFEARMGITGETVFGTYDSGPARIEVRSFAPSAGVPEDPVCGSGNGSVGLFAQARGLADELGTSYVAAQGRCVGRDGLVQMRLNPAGTVQVGGPCVTCVDGRIRT